VIMLAVNIVRKKKNSHFTMYSSCAYRSLVDQMDDAQVSFVISNKQVSKVTVKTEGNSMLSAL
jgi:hypothetical protein